jgi:hypothetical protein
MKISLAIASLLIYVSCFAEWAPLTTGINDHLTGVAFFGNMGVVSGHHGIYYTNTGGNGASEWTRFTVTTNTADSAVYEHTKFLHLASNHEATSYSTFFACGQDTVSNRAVIFRVELSNLQHQIIYYGPQDTQLNFIQKRTGFNDYYAVGNHGLLVHFNTLDFNLVTTLTTGITEDLNCLSAINNRLFIGYDGGMLKATGNGSTLTLANNLVPGKNFNELTEESWDYSFKAVGNGYYSKSGETGTYISELSNYDFGPLDANTIIQLNSYFFVGTDHGIFRNTSTGSTNLEWQPIAGTNCINEFWKSPQSPALLYACGDSGTLLFCNDLGGNTKPYVKITGNGGCVNSSTSLNLNENSSIYCAWYLDGVYSSGSCTNYSHFFNQPGTHEVKFIGSNNQYSDTSIVTIHIVSPPQINLQTFIADSILCHSEPVSITIANPENNVSYSLLKFGASTAYGASGEATGGPLSYLTTPLTTEGNYYLRASSTLASCFNNFTDTIHFEVEKTEAKFHCDLFNAYVNEPIQFINHSIDASQYEWIFSNSATTPSSNAEDVINQFSQTGQTTTTLISISAHGCTDTLIKTTALVCNPSNTEDDSWYNRTRTIEEFSFSNAGDHSIVIRMLPRPNGEGYIVLGYCVDTRIPTQNGDSAILAISGHYIAQYDDFGTLKWFVRLISSSIDPSFVHDIAVDQEGNILLTGSWDDEDSHLLDNYGNRLNFYQLDPEGYGVRNFFLKLDNRGKLVWHKLSRIHFSNLATDNNGRIAVSCSTEEEPLVWSNGIMDTLDVGSGHFARILLFDFSGNYLYQMTLDHLSTSVPQGWMTKMAFDANNNLYVSGGLTYNVAFYSSNMQIGLTTNFNPNGYGKPFLVKYDENGMFMWFSYSTSQHNVYIFDLFTTGEGDSYICGENYCGPSLNQYIHRFYSSDGTSIQTNRGNFYVAKINTNGIFEWVRALHSSEVGYGQNVFVKGDEVSVLGMVVNLDQNLSLETVSFYDNSGVNLPITMNRTDYFIAVYDTSGNARRFIKNGCNNLSTKSYYGEIEHFVDDNNFYYIACNWRSNGPAYSDFGHEFPAEQMIEGKITKLKPPDGIVVTPGYYSTNTISNCNDSLTFPDGTTFVSPNIPNFYESVLPTASGIDSVVASNVIQSTSQNNDYNIFVCRHADYTFQDGHTETDITLDTDYSYVVETNYGCINTYNYHLFIINDSITVQINGGNIVSSSNTGLMQWIDCSDNSSVFGQNANIFTPQINGNYAIAVNNIGCFDTSVCIAYNEVGISESEKIICTILPNPSITGLFTITSYTSISSLTVTNLAGELIETIISPDALELNFNVKEGVYFVTVYGENGLMAREKIIAL